MMSQILARAMFVCGLYAVCMQIMSGPVVFLFCLFQAGVVYKNIKPDDQYGGRDTAG